MIQKIFTFGTSNTAGGGFEFESKYLSHDKRGELRKINRGDLLKKLYTEEPKTQNHYSWPGQLQKLLNDKNYKISVNNISKQGYGNERMYRKFFDLVKHGDDYINGVPKENCLFIFEFSDISRKEFWFEPINNHIVMNYKAVQDDSGAQMAHSYYYDNKEILMKIEEKQNLFVEFRKNLIDIDNELKDVSRKITMFIDFLEYNNFNFMISSSPFILDMEYQNEYDKFEKYLMEFGFDEGKKYKDFHRFADIEQIRIMDETKEEITDIHSSLFGNKTIAKNVFNEMIEKKYIDGSRVEVLNNNSKNIKNTLL